VALSRKQIDEIALLARLHLEPDEIERMQGELGAILEHFKVIAEVDTTGVAPLMHAVAIESTLRPDLPMPSLPVEEALRGAPKREGDLFVVPSILPVQPGWTSKGRSELVGARAGQSELVGARAGQSELVGARADQSTPVGGPQEGQSALVGPQKGQGVTDE